MRFKTAAIAAAAITSSLAIPVPLVYPLPSADNVTPIADNTMSYVMTYFDDWEYWAVQVGRPYIEGVGCNPILETLKKHANIDSYGCEATHGFDQTLLNFTIPSPDTMLDPSHVTDALEEAYPMISAHRISGCFAASKKSRREDGEDGLPDPKDLSVPIATDAAVCNFGLDGSMFSYDMRIGRPFIEGKGCEPISVTLDQHGKISDYECNQALNSDQTLLSFKSSGDVDLQDIFDGLEEAYPMVSFDQCCPACLKKDKPESRRHEITVSTTAPIEQRDIYDPIPTDSAVCSTKYGGGFALVDWTVQVGRPFMNGGGCDPILATMQEHNDIEKWNCNQTFGFDQTLLEFTISLASKQNMDDVVPGLQEAYPMIPFDKMPSCGQPKTGSESRRDEIAVSVQPRDLSPIPDDTAVCEINEGKTGKDWFMVEWSVQVGRPFIDGKGCDPILTTLKEHGKIDKFVCSATHGFDQTVLNFTAELEFYDDWAGIAAALQEAYPMVPFDKASGCEPKKKSKTRRDEITPSLATSVQPRGLSPIADDSAVCVLGLDGMTVTWSVQVGRPFIEGRGCDPIQATLKQHADFSHFVCSATLGFDQTVLNFTMFLLELSKFDDIIAGLQEAYPMVPFDKAPGCQSKKPSRRDEAAVPVQQRDLGPVATDSARCIQGPGPRPFTFSWSLQVGRPYSGGQNCDSTLATLNKYRGPITDYICNETSGSDQAGLYFTSTTPNKAPMLGLVADGLSEAYPGIDFRESCWPKPSGTPGSPPLAAPPNRRDELDPWGNIWGPGSQAIAIPTTVEDPLHMFAARTSTTGIMGYDIQIHIPFDENSVCNYVYSILQQAAQINEWGCIDDNLGGTAIKFTALDRTSDHCQPGIYEMLNQAYPWLGVIEKRPGWPGDCPVPSGWPTSDTPIIP